MNIATPTSYLQFPCPSYSSITTSFSFLITQHMLSIRVWVWGLHGSMGNLPVAMSSKRNDCTIDLASLNLHFSVDGSQWRDALLAKALRIKETEGSGLNGTPILTHQQHYRNRGGKDLEKGCEGLSEVTAAVVTCIIHTRSSQSKHLHRWGVCGGRFPGPNPTDNILAVDSCISVFK